MDMREVIKKTEQFVYDELHSEGSGHDWYHIDRVRKLALNLAQMEGEGDLFIIEMASLLHDIPDEKLNVSQQDGMKKLLQWLNDVPLELNQKEHIVQIIETISFKGGNEAPLTSIEAKIVRDADRLDAIGAIGIARTFAYAGNKGNPIYDPNIEVREKMTVHEYRKAPSSAIQHFYEKLLKLKDLMQTTSGRKLAIERHLFLEQYLSQFFKEWNGEI